jgi:hypothetical protein
MVGSHLFDGGSFYASFPLIFGLSDVGVFCALLLCPTMCFGVAASSLWFVFSGTCCGGVVVAPVECHGEQRYNDHLHPKKRTKPHHVASKAKTQRAGNETIYTLTSRNHVIKI